MIILDLFAGQGDRERRAKIEARGHRYVTLDIDARFGCTITGDIMEKGWPFLASYGRSDFIWASPPCEAFSVASIGTHWTGGHRAYTPATPHAKHSIELVERTLSIIRQAAPRLGWIIENPRGVLRKLAVLKNFPRSTVTYCQYGDTRMKPTDLWGSVPGWVPRPMCRNGDPCHERAPRGAKTGTQGIKGAAARAVVPWQLWDEMLTCLEGQP